MNSIQQIQEYFKDTNKTTHLFLADHLSNIFSDIFQSDTKEEYSKKTKELANTLSLIVKDRSNEMPLTKALGICFAQKDFFLFQNNIVDFELKRSEFKKHPNNDVVDSNVIKSLSRFFDKLGLFTPPLSYMRFEYLQFNELCFHNKPALFALFEQNCFIIFSEDYYLDTNKLGLLECIEHLKEKRPITKSKFLSNWIDYITYSNSDKYALFFVETFFNLELPKSSRVDLKEFFNKIFGKEKMKLVEEKIESLGGHYSNFSKEFSEN